MTTRLVRMTGLEPARQRQRNLNPPSLPIPPHPHITKLVLKLPVAVPGIFVDLKRSSSSADRCHSLTSLHPIRKGAIAPGNRFVHDSLRSATPQAALGSLPTTSACMRFGYRRFLILPQAVEVVNCSLWRIVLKQLKFCEYNGIFLDILF